MKVFSRRAFPLDWVVLLLIVAALFLAAYGLTAGRKALANPTTTIEQPEKRNYSRHEAVRKRQGGLLCAPCTGPHIDLRTGDYRWTAGPGPGLRLRGKRGG